MKEGGQKGGGKWQINRFGLPGYDNFSRRLR